MGGRIIGVPDRDHASVDVCGQSVDRIEDQLRYAASLVDDHQHVARMPWKARRAVVGRLAAIGDELVADVQHNPQAPDGADAFIGFVTGFAGQFPELSIEIKRAVGEGDIVVTHGLIKTPTEDPGTVAADFFRLENGKIVEHWDVLQPFPETTANDHPMF
jgi:predicted SnoaL-like aldol condensation-catalyzing enzyme